MAVLHALAVPSLIVAAVLPALDALPILQVVLPVPLVLGTVDVHVDSVAVGLVVLPLTVIYIAIGMPELAAAISLVHAPLALVLGIIWPDLDTGTMAHVVEQIAAINGAILEDEFFSELQALRGRSLLQFDEVRIIGLEQRSGAIRPGSRVLGLRRQFAVAIIARLRLPQHGIRRRFFNLDLTLLLSLIFATASVSHFSTFYFLSVQR